MNSNRIKQREATSKLWLFILFILVIVPNTEAQLIAYGNGNEGQSLSLQAGIYPLQFYHSSGRHLDQFGYTWDGLEAGYELFHDRIDILYSINFVSIFSGGVAIGLTTNLKGNEWGLTSKALVGIVIFPILLRFNPYYSYIEHEYGLRMDIAIGVGGLLPLFGLMDLGS